MHAAQVVLHTAQAALHAAQITLHTAQIVLHDAQTVLHPAQAVFHIAQAVLLASLITCFKFKWLETLKSHPALPRCVFSRASFSICSKTSSKDISVESISTAFSATMSGESVRVASRSSR